MRTTASIPTAARRLAEALGFGLNSEGRAWRLTSPDGEPWSVATPAAHALGTLIVVAVAPESQRGRGLGYGEVADLCRLDIPPERLRGAWWDGEIRRMLLAGRREAA